MNLLVDKLKGAQAGQVHNYAAEHERTSAELQFLKEMIHNVEIEINTYQQEYSQLQGEDEGYVSQVMERFKRKKSEEKLVRTDIFTN